MQKMRQKEYPGSLWHQTHFQFSIALIRMSWWLNNIFFHETSKKLLVFLFLTDTSICPLGLREFQNLYSHIQFSSDWGKPCMLNDAVLLKACHHSLQDIWYGEGQCYSFTLPFISFDFIKKKYTKIWKGKDKGFTNNHLQCNAVVLPLSTLLFSSASIQLST